MVLFCWKQLMVAKGMDMVRNHTQIVIFLLQVFFRIMLSMFYVSMACKQTTK